MKKASVACGVAGRGVFVVGNLPAAEERRHHRADAVGNDGHAGIHGRLRQSRLEPVGELLQALVGAVVKQVERFPARAHGQRIARQRPRLIDRAERRDLIHQLRAAAVGGGGQPAADDLAEAGQVGLDAVARLGAAPVHAEPGHDLVENQHDPERAGEFAQTLEVTGCRRDDPHVAGDGLDDQSGDFRATILQQPLDGGGVVERNHVRQLGQRLRHSGTARQTERHHARTRVDQKRIDVTVVAAFDLDHLVAARRPARQADRRHRRLGP